MACSDGCKSEANASTFTAITEVDIDSSGHVGAWAMDIVQIGGGGPVVSRVGAGPYLVHGVAQDAAQVRGRLSDPRVTTPVSAIWPRHGESVQEWHGALSPAAMGDASVFDWTDWDAPCPSTDCKGHGKGRAVAVIVVPGGDGNKTDAMTMNNGNIKKAIQRACERAGRDAKRKASTACWTKSDKRCLCDSRCGECAESHPPMYVTEAVASVLAPEDVEDGDKQRDEATKRGMSTAGGILFRREVSCSGKCMVGSLPAL
jgi:hypothetical protein